MTHRIELRQNYIFGIHYENATMPLHGTQQPLRYKIYKILIYTNSYFVKNSLYSCFSMLKLSHQFGFFLMLK